VGDSPPALLLDQNLSYKLVPTLAAVFPNTVHARDVGLASADDRQVWEYAKLAGRLIVSKDADFHDRSFLWGAPPKVIWIRLGNCSTAAVGSLLLARRDAILAFSGDPETTFLELS
jgi:predicted nuclease of predicted toxin-antitoxin system